MDGQITPAEKIRPTEDLRVVDDDKLVAMEYRAGIRQTDQPASRSCSCKIDLVPGVALQTTGSVNLDSTEAERLVRIGRNEQLPVGFPQRSRRSL